MCGAGGAHVRPARRTARRAGRSTRRGRTRTTGRSSRVTPGRRGRLTEIAVHRPAAARMGFFTDTTVCIGCKACEVACKQWNDLPADGGGFGKRGSYDSTGALGASTWRHVRFVESVAEGEHDVDLVGWAEANGGLDGAGFDVATIDKWMFMSDVCKHCTNAG